jgi:hypothetical protein
MAPLTGLALPAAVRRLDNDRQIDTIAARNPPVA